MATSIGDGGKGPVWSLRSSVTCACSGPTFINWIPDDICASPCSLRSIGSATVRAPCQSADALYAADVSGGYPPDTSFTTARIAPPSVHGSASGHVAPP